MPNARKSNRWPVVMYPEGEPVGWVVSSRNSRTERAEHVAIDLQRVTVGTYDTFQEARDILIQAVRQSRGQRYWSTEGDVSTYHDRMGEPLGRVKRETVMRAEEAVTRFVPYAATGDRLNPGYRTMDQARTLVESRMGV